MDKQTREALAQQEALEKEIQKLQQKLDSFDRWRKRQDAHFKPDLVLRMLLVAVLVINVLNFAIQVVNA